jgi:hypothetical protein
MVYMDVDKTPWRISIEIPKEDCPYLYFPANIHGCKDPKNESGECRWSKCPYRIGGC